MRCKAFTLVEMVLSLTIATILLAGMSSALFLATRALPSEARPGEQLTSETEAVCDLVSELSCACNMLERGVRAVSFTVADRNGDGSPESIRYGWSGTPGEPLMRQYNNGAPVAVLPDVREFALAYDLAAVEEEYPGPPVESSLYTLSSRTSSILSQDFAIKNKSWIGQYFCPTFPAGTLSWKVKRVEVRARYKGALDGVTAVQLRPATNGKLPETQVIDEALMYESALEESYRWEKYEFDDANGLTPGAGLCLVLVRQVTDVDLAEVLYDRAGSGLLYTGDGSTWYYYDSRSLLYTVSGTHMTPGAPQTATRRYVTNVRIALRAGEGSENRIDTAARTVNAPEALTAIWETEFDSNPTTLDMNGDGSGDWTPESGSFDAARVSGGVWNANSNLLTYPDNDFNQLITVELRFRCTTVSSSTRFGINADRSNGNCVPLRARLTLAGDGTQTLTVYCKPESGTTTTLLTLPGLPTSMVTVRLLIDPATDTVNVRANDADRGTFTYVLSAEGGSAHAASLVASGTTAEFDYVRIRVGGN